MSRLRTTAADACSAMEGAGPGTRAMGAVEWLHLAATPTFAAMALLTGVGGGPADMLCSAAPGPSPLTGMTLMYLLMGTFHSAPWLKLISGLRNRVRGDRVHER